MPASRPRFVRVERILRNSESSWSVIGASSAVSSRKTPRGSTTPAPARAPPRRPARAISPTRALGAPSTEQLFAVEQRRADALRLERLLQTVAPGARTRTAPASCAVSSASGAKVTSLPLSMITTWSTVCATSASTWLEQRPSCRPRRTSAGSRAASGRPPGRGRSQARRGSAAPGRPAARPRGRAAAASRASSCRHGGAPRRAELDQLEHPLDTPGRSALPATNSPRRSPRAERQREREQMVAAGAARMEVGRLRAPHRPRAAGRSRS